MVNDIRTKMGTKLVITIIDVSNPMVMAEFEKNTDATLVHFGVNNQAVFEIISGAFEPSALLPFQMPATMRSVDEQFEDTPRDMDSYTNSMEIPMILLLG